MQGVRTEMSKESRFMEMHSATNIWTPWIERKNIIFEGEESKEMKNVVH